MTGYTLSKPIQLKITQLMFIDDIKLFTSNDIPSPEGSQAVLERSEHESRQRQMCCYDREERKMHHNQAFQLNQTPIRSE